MLTYATVFEYLALIEDEEIQKHSLIKQPILGRIKDFQRPWAYKFLKSKCNKTTKVLEIGAGSPSILNALQQETACECWVTDPMEGVGNGPTNFDKVQIRFPTIRFIKQYIGTFSPDLPESYFDFVFSVSVLEHIPLNDWDDCFADMLRITKKGGTIFHAIDVSIDGDKGHDDMLGYLLGFAKEREFELYDPLKKFSLDEIRNDPLLYYVSPQVWMEWRKSAPAGGQFFHGKKFRRITSVNIVLKKI